MDSIGENCNELKKQYDSCFLNWFSGRFLKGDTNDEVCAPFFKVYQQCVKVCTYCNNLKFVHFRDGDLS
ncbi:TP53-regulated inhibitor of apoptosis 1 [Cryptotermes secundus]|uniref:TP53-regulated inhibitor of apoptosis 1 n=1 Tax=Cryptotermes secundus TaxID=105785 RepID=A0A2J7R7H6_9NEOP|nr:TP53-regulated inhibitor of apoptosis 1 [Cryptotermes secundus]